MPIEIPRPQFILFFPPGTSTIDGEEVSNEVIANNIIKDLEAGLSASITALPGWQLIIIHPSTIKQAQF